LLKLILVRHGQTFWNREMKYQGHSDIVLDEEGLRQAELVGERLKQESVQAVYSSDLKRAMVTAEKIAAHHGLPVGIMPDLREIMFGEWEGYTFQFVYERWPQEADKLFTSALEARIPGGETFEQVKERAQRAIDELTAKHQDQTVVVVCHGGIIRTILCNVLGIDLNRVWDIKQDNTAVNIIEVHPGRNVIALVNDTHHLEKTLKKVTS